MVRGSGRGRGAGRGRGRGRGPAVSSSSSEESAGAATEEVASAAHPAAEVQAVSGVIIQNLRGRSSNSVSKCRQHLLLHLHLLQSQLLQRLHPRLG